ncbi:MAG: hypothetical protein P4L50_17555 [Anaerolineaceae bacterium]|nr:hypothetical protein [Anaerolineaceae bacterium]
MSDLDKDLNSTADTTAPRNEWRPNGNGGSEKHPTRNGIIITLMGLVVFLIGARPSLFDLDRSPVIGFVQISVFLVGLGIISVGGYISLHSLWGKQATSIAADIGLRMVTTGYLISVFSGMADIFGFGSHHLPHPFYGYLQEEGVFVGEMAIAIGFLMLIPYNHFQAHKTEHPEK